METGQELEMLRLEKALGKPKGAPRELEGDFAEGPEVTGQGRTASHWKFFL